MQFFVENSSLESMNTLISRQLPKIELIGDLTLTRGDFEYLAHKIGMHYSSDLRSLFYSKYRECFVVFLVFCAVFEYDNRTFWKSVESYLGPLNFNRKDEINNVFSRVINENNLNNFVAESEEGYAHVTPILCHAGIPINAFEAYFDAINNTVNDTFYDDFSVDDYVSYLQNKTEITVRRYINLAKKIDAYNFIQNTRKLILLDDQDESSNGNHIRMTEQLSLWKEKPKTKKILKAKSNIQISAPKIKINLDEENIFIELPKIVVKDSLDSYIIWDILSDEINTIVKADLYSNNGDPQSEEKKVLLKPASTYTVVLRVDDNQISKWEFKGVQNNFIAFLLNGNLVKRETLPSESIILLLNQSIEILNKEDLPIIEFPKLPGWGDFQLFSIDLSNLNELKCNGMVIQVFAEKKPELSGGETLLNQSDSNVYMKLPYIKVPYLNDGEWHLDITHKKGNEILNKFNLSVASNFERIFLDSIIPPMNFGVYELKVWHRHGINVKMNFEYVPWAKIDINENEYWPSHFQGYKNNIVTIKASKFTEFEIHNAEKLTPINLDNFTICKYKCTDKSRYIFGEYKYSYKEYSFSTPIKKIIHPINWGIIGLENDLIELPNKVYSLTLLDISNSVDPYLLFTFDIVENFKVESVRFDLVGNDKISQYTLTKSIHNKKALRVPLNTFMFEVENAEFVDFQLNITLLESNEIPITSFVVTRFQEEVIVTDVVLKQTNEDVELTWNETGVLCSRECILVNFTKSWITPYHIKIEDKLSKVIINCKDLEEGIYKYIIQKESDELFADTLIKEISTLVGFQKGKIIVRGNNSFSSAMESLLFNLMKTRFLKKEIIHSKLTEVELELKKLRHVNSEDFRLLTHTYILFKRFYSNKDDALQLQKIFNRLFELFINSSDENIKYILESDFNNKHKKYLLNVSYSNNFLKQNNLNDFQLKLLEEIDENSAGFINLFKLEDNRRGLNWAGIKNINELFGESLFSEEIDYRKIINIENFGDPTQLRNYYEYIYKCLLSPKNQNKKSEDFIKEYQRQNEVSDTLIFGKTRLQLVVEWKQKKNDTKSINEKLSSILLFHNNLPKTDEFEELFETISKRRLDDESGYYIGLIAIYASLIRNGIYDDNLVFSRLLSYTIETCGKLYYRDLIFIELYVRQKRGYAWG